MLVIEKKMFSCTVLLLMQAYSVVSIWPKMFVNEKLFACSCEMVVFTISVLV